MFYCPSHTTNIVKVRNARFLEDNDISGSEQPRNSTIKKMRVPITTLVNLGWLSVLQGNPQNVIMEE